jgi:hypothetical protein
MRLLAMALMLTGCMTVASTGAMLAQSSSPSPEAAGQRVEVPEAGLALTLPKDWEVRVRMQAMEVEVPSWAEGLASAWQALDSWAPGEYPEAGAGGCQLALIRANEPAAGTVTLDDLASFDFMAFWADQDFDGSHVTTDIELPAGEASRVDVIEHDHDGHWYAGVYRLSAPDGAVMLLCIGFEERPDDGWLSVADSLEFLPGGPAAAADYEITFPDGWTVRQPTSEEALSMFRGFPPEQRPLVRANLMAEPPDQSATCTLVDESVLVVGRTTWTSVEDAIVAEVVAAQKRPRQAVSGSALLELSAGRVGRVDMLYDGAVTISTFHLTDGTAWFYLQCGAADPPDDRWLSIAQTFEFLPVEE